MKQSLQFMSPFAKPLTRDQHGAHGAFQIFGADILGWSGVFVHAARMV